MGLIRVLLGSGAAVNAFKVRVHMCVPVRFVLGLGSGSAVRREGPQSAGLRLEGIVRMDTEGPSPLGKRRKAYSIATERLPLVSFRSVSVSVVHMYVCI